MTILVTGARGRVGSALLDALLVAGIPAHSLRAGGRDPGALTPPGGVETVGADLDDPRGLVTSLAGVDQVFAYAPGTDPAATFAAMSAAGVRHVVLLSSFTVDRPDGRDDPIGAHHVAAEQALIASDLEATLLRPGAFSSNALAWASDIRERGVVKHAYPEARTTPIHETDIADAAAVALTAPPGSAPRGGAVDLSGPESLTFREQVATLDRELDRTVELVEIGPAELRDRMLAKSVPEAIVESTARLWGRATNEPDPVHDLRPVTGRPARGFATWVREHRSVFEG